MHVLVTGGAGFIGSFLVDELIRREYQVRVFDNLDSQVHGNNGPPSYLNAKAEYLWGDMKGYDQLNRAVSGVDLICHLASVVGVGQSQYQVKRYVDNNVGGTANLLNLLVNTKHQVKKLIVAASMSSYGEGAYRCKQCGDVNAHLRSERQLERGDWEVRCASCQGAVQAVPTTENKAQKCDSIYAITKKVQEEMAMIIGRVYGIPTVALRYFNVYGPRQSLSNPYTGVAAIFLSRIKNDQPPVIYEDGMQTRDFVSVHDITSATILAMESESADYKVYNVGTGRPRSVVEIASTLTAILGKDLEPKIVGRYRKGDVRHCFADIAKIQQDLGFRPQVEFGDGFEELVAWSGSARANDGFDRAAEELKIKGLVI